jgi:hypothetical protein
LLDLDSLDHTAIRLNHLGKLRRFGRGELTARYTIRDRTDSCQRILSAIQGRQPKIHRAIPPGRYNPLDAKPQRSAVARKGEVNSFLD